MPSMPGSLDAVRERVSFEANMARRRTRDARTRLSFAANRRLLANRSSRRRLSPEPPVLTAAQESVLGELQEHGIAITSFVRAGERPGALGGPELGRGRVRPRDRGASCRAARRR